MRDVCQVDVIVSAKDKHLPPADVAARLFEVLRNCRVLSASIIGPRLKVELLLPEVPGGFRNLVELKGFVEMGLTGKGAVLASVHSIREATPVEILNRALAKTKLT